LQPAAATKYVQTDLYLKKNTAFFPQSIFIPFLCGYGNIPRMSLNSVNLICIVIELHFCEAVGVGSKFLYI
jgi:hypothetical protein